MKTHFHPWGLSDDAEIAPCGTWMGESSNMSGEWARVDCARCQKQKTKIMAVYKAEEPAIVEQKGDMAHFMSKQVEGM